MEVVNTPDSNANMVQLHQQHADAGQVPILLCSKLPNVVSQLLKVRHCQAPPRLSRLLCTPHLKASEKAAASSRVAHVQSACSSDPSLREQLLYHMRLSTGLQQQTHIKALSNSCSSGIAWQDVNLRGSSVKASILCVWDAMLPACE